MVNQGNVTTYDGEIPSSRERRRIVDESGRDAVLFDVSASEIGKIKIWDCVDGTWTEPLEKGLAMEHYLRKLIYKCSCCIDASLFEADIKKHLTQLKLSYEIHKDAQLERGLGDSGVMTSVSMPEQIVDTVEFGNRNTEVHKNTRSDVKAEIKPKRHRRRRKR